jgi:hypothetical protein
LIELEAAFCWGAGLAAYRTTGATADCGGAGAAAGALGAAAIVAAVVACVAVDRATVDFGGTAAGLAVATWLVRLIVSVVLVGV